jgi:hypothetical protein
LIFLLAAKATDGAWMDRSSIGFKGNAESLTMILLT